MLQNEPLGVMIKIIQNQNTKKLRKSRKQINNQIIQIKNTFIILLPMAHFAQEGNI